MLRCLARLGQGEMMMKPNWIAGICGVVFVAATFCVAFLEGANIAHEAATKETPASLAQAR